MEGSKRRSGPTAEDPFFMMVDLVAQVTKCLIIKKKKNLEKGIDKPAKMSIIVTVRMRCGKHPKEGEPDDDELLDGDGLRDGEQGG